MGLVLGVLVVQKWTQWEVVWGRCACTVFFVVAVK
jgi:hypothetical protein